MTKTAPRPAETKQRSRVSPRSRSRPGSGARDDRARHRAASRSPRPALGPDLRRQARSASGPAHDTERRRSRLRRRAQRRDRGLAAPGDAVRARVPRRRDAIAGRAVPRRPEPTPAEIAERARHEGAAVRTCRRRSPDFKRRSLTAALVGLRRAHAAAAQSRRAHGRRDRRRARRPGTERRVGLAGVDPASRARRGEYFARFEIVDPNGVMLAVADSQKFPGLIS